MLAGVGQFDCHMALTRLHKSELETALSRYGADQTSTQAPLLLNLHNACSMTARRRFQAGRSRDVQEGTRKCLAREVGLACHDAAAHRTKPAALVPTATA